MKIKGVSARDTVGENNIGAPKIRQYFLEIVKDVRKEILR